jgi:hypothetical protein
VEFDPYISTQDFEALLGEELEDPGALIVGIALDSACTAVRTYLGQNINLVENDVEIRSGNGRRKMRLRQRPVRSVSSIVVDDETIDLDTVSVRGAVLTMKDRGWWQPGDDNIVVTYTHGWDVIETPEPQNGVPADIRLVTLLVARRIYEAVGFVQTGAQGGAIISETIGEYSYTLSDAAETSMASAAELVDGEKFVLDAYRIELVGDTPTQ